MRHESKLDSLGREPQQEKTKRGKPLSELRTCTCHQEADGSLRVDPDCPLHGHLHKRDAKTGELVLEEGRIPRVAHPRIADPATTKTA